MGRIFFLISLVIVLIVVIHGKNTHRCVCDTCKLLLDAFMGVLLEGLQEKCLLDDNFNNNTKRKREKS